MLTKLGRKSADAACKAIVNRLRNLPKKARKTLTLDNGTENAMHGKITSSICSWERGTNENLNGLIRWYLPKGTDFSNISNRLNTLNPQSITNTENVWTLKNQPKLLPLLLHFKVECNGDQ